MNFLISRYVDALSARKIWFKIHIKLYSVVYTVGAQMGCHIAQFVSALNAEWEFHFCSLLDTLHHAGNCCFYSSFYVNGVKKSLKRHKNKNCYLIWEMWDKLNFHNEVFFPLFHFLLSFYNSRIKHFPKKRISYFNNGTRQKEEEEKWLLEKLLLNSNR